MTHPGFLEEDFNRGKYDEIFNEMGIGLVGGFIKSSAPDSIYTIATKMGVNNFVVPGNKPDRITHYKNLIEKCGVQDPVFFSPGLVAQGGEITEGAKAAGKYFHGIVGKGITKAENIREATLELISKL